jgi:hypothetical protein
MTRSQQAKRTDSDNKEETTTHNPNLIDLPSSDRSTLIRGRSRSIGSGLCYEPSLDEKKCI